MTKKLILRTSVASYQLDTVLISQFMLLNNYQNLESQFVKKKLLFFLHIKKIYYQIVMKQLKVRGWSLTQYLYPINVKDIIHR